MEITEFNVRAHKALVEAWPLVQKGSISSIKNSVGKLVEATPDNSFRMSKDLMFAIQDAWAYVHSFPGQGISEARSALQVEFKHIMRCEVSSPQLDATIDRKVTQDIEVLRSEMSELEKLRQALEIIAVGDCAEPQLMAEKVLIEIGYWTSETNNTEKPKG